MSIEENYNQSIRLYPNPTTGLININIKDFNRINFDVFSINGKLIKSYSYYELHQVDFNFLHKGIYFMRFYIDNKVIVKKIIKK
jgi:penicillin-binding protein-related factor A (putative recombinase)